jgi:hypothetical protein
VKVDTDGLFRDRSFRLDRVDDFRAALVWEGVVHVFYLEGHPKATRAYAWVIANRT